MRTILFAALIEFTTAGGAPFGAYAIPLMIFAFLGGLKRGSSGETPPVAADAFWSEPELAPPVLAASAEAGERHASNSRQAQSSIVRKRGGISLSSAYGVS